MNAEKKKKSGERIKHDKDEVVGIGGEKESIKVYICKFEGMLRSYENKSWGETKKTLPRYKKKVSVISHYKETWTRLGACWTKGR